MTLELDPKTTALVLIDLQQGILRMPVEPYRATDVLQNAAALGRAIAGAGGTIVLVNVGFAADSADRLRQPVDSPPVIPAGGFPADYSDLAPEIAALPAKIRITKRQWGAFYGTELDLQLRRRGITTIVLGGIATNFGVETTAREAWQHGYAVVLVEDACTSVNADAHRMAIEKVLPRIARVRKTADVVAALAR